MATTTQKVGSATDVNGFKISTKKGLTQFLRAIHPGFLAYVDPRHSRLLDIMIQNELLTDSDQESLSGKGVYVRRDQARKLWFSLHKMRVRDFTCTVLPELCSNFPHILPEEWMDSNEDGPDEECFRHDITDKIRPATMADLLFDCHCLSLEDYKDVSETNINQEMIWEALFEAVRRKTTGDTEQALRGLLTKRKVDVPDNFLDLLSSGIPCTCRRSEQRLLPSITTATSEEKITKWFMMSHSKGGSTVHGDLCTTVDGLSIAERDTDSLFGSGEGSFFGQNPTRAKPPFSGECFRFLLLGKTRSGKSTTGNTIFGEKLFNTAVTFSSVTSDCEMKVSNRGGRKIEIIDSPGLYDTPAKTQEEICVTIVQALACMHPGPHAILFVVRMGRYTAEEYNTYKRIKALFDENITKYTIVLFTHGDMLEHNRKSIDLLDRATPKTLQEVLKECSNRYIVFNNKARDTHAQVEQLLSMVRHMVAQNGGQAYSCPKYGQIGQGMEEEVARRLQEVEKKDLKRQMYVLQLEKEIHEAKETAQRTKEQFRKNEPERQRRMEAEKQRQEFAQQIEEQCRQDREELQKREEERERLYQEKRDEEKAAAKKREEDREREMGKLRENIVNEEESNFIEQTASTIAGIARRGAFKVFFEI